MTTASQGGWWWKIHHCERSRLWSTTINQPFVEGPEAKASEDGADTGSSRDTLFVDAAGPSLSMDQQLRWPLQPEIVHPLLRHGLSWGTPCTVVLFDKSIPVFSKLILWVKHLAFVTHLHLLCCIFCALICFHIADETSDQTGSLQHVDGWGQIVLDKQTPHRPALCTCHRCHFQNIWFACLSIIVTIALERMPRKLVNLRPVASLYLRKRSVHIAALGRGCLLLALGAKLRQHPQGSPKRIAVKRETNLLWAYIAKDNPTFDELHVRASKSCACVEK